MHGRTKNDTARKSLVSKISLQVPVQTFFRHLHKQREQHHGECARAFVLLIDEIRGRQLYVSGNWFLTSLEMNGWSD
jgi:hypothetical protein